MTPTYAGYRDFPEFIIGITKRIWEDREVSALNELYAPDIIVRSPDSVVDGNRAVIRATLATLAEFPDRTLYGEDVIWCGAPQDGLLSSHRIVSEATHQSDGAYGKATGKRIRYRIVADCHALNGRIDDEWLVRDQGAIVRQIGQSPESFVRGLAREEGAVEKWRIFTPDQDRPGPYRGTGAPAVWGAHYADILKRIMAGDLAVIPREYDRAVELAYPGGGIRHSHAAADGFWLGLRSAFPAAAFEIHHCIGREDARLPPRAAIRWSLHGRHDGAGAFGRPTGAEVHVMGICHAEFGPRGVRREYVLLDEVAIWKQIVRQEG